jgi:hypothetical protein
VKKLSYLVFLAIVGCGGSSSDDSSSNGRSDEFSIDERFLASTYQDSVAGRSFSDDDLSGTWIMVKSSTAARDDYNSTTLERKIFNVGKRSFDGYESFYEDDYTSTCATTFGYRKTNGEFDIFETVTDIVEFEMVDSAYFYYTTYRYDFSDTAYETKAEYIKISDDKIDLGDLTEVVIAGNGDSLINETNNVSCFSEEQKYQDDSSIQWTTNSYDIFSDVSRYISIKPPVDNEYYVYHDLYSIDDLSQRGAAVSIDVATWTVTGTTEVTAEDGRVGTSQFEVSVNL